MFSRDKSSLNTVVTFLVILTSYSLTYAKENIVKRSEVFVWVNGGVGIVSKLWAGGINFSIQPPKPGHLIFSLRGLSATDFYEEIRGEGALLVGYSTKKPQSKGYVSITAGIAYVSSSSVGQMIGFPVDVQLFYTLLPCVGIGLEGIVNVNREETFYGALFCLQFGRLR